VSPVNELVARRYRVIRPLAAGGLSRVWLAQDTRDGRRVAIKRCAVPGGLTPEEQDVVRAWTLREARAFARVRHPAVVRVLDVVPDPGDSPWLVMEYVPSRSLRELVDASGPLSPARAAEVGLAVLAGLAAAGRAGVLHLDVKPGNVLIADDGRALLSDFAPAVTEQGVGALHRAGIILGSPNYVAPERLFDGVSTARSDLWSLGATLYYAVEGRPPFGRSSTEDTLRALDAGRPDPVRLAGPLAEVLDGLLRRDPAARLTARQVARRLRAVSGRSRMSLGYPPRRLVPRSLSGPRRRVAVVAAGLTAAATLAGAAVTADRGGRDDARPGGQPVALGTPAVAARPPYVLPSGYRWWNDDPGGFRVAVPEQWRAGRDKRGALVVTGIDGVTRLRISTWTGRADTVTALIAAERATSLPGYQRIKIEPLPQAPDALWEYTYRPAGATMRGQDRVLTEGGRTYRIEWRAPRADWADRLPVLGVVLDSFRPLPGA
jgi:hypothetical protein